MNAKPGTVSRTFEESSRFVHEVPSQILTYPKPGPIRLLIPEKLYGREPEIEGPARVLLPCKEPRYEMRVRCEDEYQHLEAAPWLQAFKDQLAIGIAKVILAPKAPK